ncbi:UNVERIFIED_CONTAM: Radial spoke head protein 9 [Siphonaria sp. JEL0065]|nr:Radial spoke head protein 9 [Siphonaria sp. JEL0065]
MSTLDISDIAQHFSLAGVTLNAQERAVMTTSLRVKAEAEKLQNLCFWGKILAIQKDYMIAQANGANLFDRKFFYSFDLVNWLQLPEVTPEDMPIIEKITKRFTGDPAFEFSTASEEVEGEEKPKGQTISEEKRLSGVIQLMNYEVQIVPRGAYFRDGNLTLQQNPMFKGLSQSELGELTNYCHFREGFNINKKTAEERATSFDETIDIFDAISGDDPRGVWSIQSERGGSVSLLRSLLWPGYVFFHTPSPVKWGGMYYGWGLKNQNIGFMLP